MVFSASGLCHTNSLGTCEYAVCSLSLHKIQTDLLMTGLVHLSALLAFVGYAFSTYSLVRALQGKSSLSRRNLRLIAFTTLVVHGLNVYEQVFTTQGIQLGVVAAAALFAFVMAVTATGMSLFRKIDVLLAPAYTLAAVAIGFSTFAGDALPPLSHLPKGLVIHIVLSIVAYTLVTLAGSQAVLIYTQNYHLKHRHLRHLLQLLPPLQTMEAMLFDLVITGWLALTIAIASGFFYVDDLFAQHLAHKTFFTVSAWVVFGLLLLGRWLWGWRGLVAVRWTISGLLLLMIGYFGTQVILQRVLFR